MTEKQVILDKRDYDAMEDELTDLRIIVASRTVLTIVEEKLNWRISFGAASGTKINYILGTDSDEDAIKVFTEEIAYLKNKLKKAEEDLDESYREQGRKSDEIKRLTNRNWFQKLFNNIQQIKRIIWHNTEKNQ